MSNTNFSKPGKIRVNRVTSPARKKLDNAPVQGDLEPLRDTWKATSQKEAVKIQRGRSSTKSSPPPQHIAKKIQRGRSSTMSNPPFPPLHDDEEFTPEPRSSRGVIHLGHSPGRHTPPEHMDWEPVEKYDHQPFEAAKKAHRIAGDQHEKAYNDLRQAHTDLQIAYEKAVKEHARVKTWNLDMATQHGEDIQRYEKDIGDYQRARAVAINKIRELEQENSDVSGELEFQRERLVEAKKALAEKTKEAKKALAEKKAEMKELRAKLGEAQKREEELGKKLALSKQQISQLRKEKQTISTNFKNHRKEAEASAKDLRSKLGEGLKREDDLRTELALANEQTSQLRVKKTSLEQEKQALSTDLDRFRKEATSRATLLGEKTDRLANLEKNMAAEKSTAAEQSKRTQAEIRKLEGEKGELTARVKENLNSIQILETAAKADRAKFDQLEKTNDANVEEKRNLKHACNEKDRQLAENQTRHDAQMAEMETANADLEKANEKMGREAQKDKAENHDLAQQVKDLKKQIKDLNSKLRGANSKIESTEEQLEHEHATIKKLETKNKKLKNDNSQLDMEIDDQAAEHTRETRKLKKELAKVKKTLAKRSPSGEDTEDELPSQDKANQNLNLPDVFSPSPLHTSSQEPSEDDDLHDYTQPPRQMQTAGTH